MPSGKVHDLVGASLTLTVSAGTAFLVPDLAIPLATGLAISVLISPDITSTRDSRSERRLKKVPVVGILFGYCFDVIAAHIPHRAWVSDSPLGTLIRAGVLWPLPLVVWIVGGWPWLGLFLAGWIAGDAGHILLDVLVSGLKRVTL